MNIIGILLGGHVGITRTIFRTITQFEW